MIKNLSSPVSSKLVSIIFGVLVLCFACGFYAFGAWTDPTGTPPNNNADAPVNVGSITQFKTGGLGVGAFTAAAVLVGTPTGGSVANGIRVQGDVCTDAGGGKCLSAAAGGSKPSDQAIANSSITYVPGFNCSSGSAVAEANMPWVDMPGMSKTINTTGGKVLIMFSAQRVGNVGGHGADVRLIIDGAASPSDATGTYSSTGQQVPLTMQYLAAGLAAGSHTFNIQWRGGEKFCLVSCNCNSVPTQGGYRVLTVVEL
jgi:hypothetical protein